MGEQTQGFQKLFKRNIVWLLLDILVTAARAYERGFIGYIKLGPGLGGPKEPLSSAHTQLVVGLHLVGYLGQSLVKIKSFFVLTYSNFRPNSSRISGVDLFMIFI